MGEQGREGRKREKQKLEVKKKEKFLALMVGMDIFALPFLI